MMIDFYTIIGKEIEQWSRDNHHYEEMVVRLRLDGTYVITEFLDFDGLDYQWLNDWYEGETEVELLGFTPLSEIQMKYGGNINDVE